MPRSPAGGGRATLEAHQVLNSADPGRWEPLRRLRTGIIGDRGNRVTIDAIVSAHASLGIERPLADMRPRIEHALGDARVVRQQGLRGAQFRVHLAQLVTRLVLPQCHHAGRILYPIAVNRGGWDG